MRHRIAVKIIESKSTACRGTTIERALRRYRFQGHTLLWKQARFGIRAEVARQVRFYARKSAASKGDGS